MTMFLKRPIFKLHYFRWCASQLYCHFVLVCLNGRMTTGDCHEIGASFLLLHLLIVLAIGIIHFWASNNFYLTRMQMFVVSFLTFLLALLHSLLAGIKANLSLEPMLVTFRFCFFSLAGL